MSQINFIPDYAAFLCAAHASFATSKGSVSLRRPMFGFKPKPHAKPWKPVLKEALAPGCSGVILEFGVYKGKTLEFLAQQHPASRLHGFDSFAGFPADGRVDWQQNMSVRSLPIMPKNVLLHAGFFEQTLPKFIQNHKIDLKEISLIHIDCDLYSSTKTVLTNLSSYLGPGTVIVFDELMNYHEFASNEFLAFFEFLRNSDLDFEWLATTGKAFPILENNAVLPAWGFAEFRSNGYYQNQAVRLVPRSQGQHFAAPPAPAEMVKIIAEQLLS